MALSASAKAASTSEQRTQWIEITHKLQDSPLDEDINQQGEAVLREIEQAHDIHVALCPALLSELNGAKYPYAHILTRQFMLASTAFMIEHPSNADDSKRDNRNAKNLAALESVLKTYGSIVQKKPNAKYSILDDILQQQVKGKLADYVKSQCP